MLQRFPCASCCLADRNGLALFRNRALEKWFWQSLTARKWKCWEVNCGLGWGGSRRAFVLWQISPKIQKNHPSTTTWVRPAALPVSPAEESWVFERQKQNHCCFPVAACFYSKVSVLLLASVGRHKTWWRKTLLYKWKNFLYLLRSEVGRSFPSSALCFIKSC